MRPAPIARRLRQRRRSAAPFKEGLGELLRAASIENTSATATAIHAPSRRSLLVSLVTEGTYPFHDGGVSVWCDQMVRGLAGHQFRIEAITTTGSERPFWTLPSNVVALRTHPLWSGLPGPSASATCDPEVEHTLREFFGTFQRPIDAAASHEHLRRLHIAARDGRLQPALMSDVAVQLALDAMAEPPPNREVGSPPRRASVADAVASLRMLEHLLRPLARPTEFADLCHATSNGLGMLIAMATKWEWGTPVILTEHGLYLRERYIALGPASMPHHQRAFMLGFFRNLSAAAYAAADVVAPGSEYNRGWEVVTGADPNSIEPIYNGIDAPSFAKADGEPDVPTLVWLGRIDPLKDVKTMLRAFAIVRDVLPGSRLRIFGGTPRGNEGYHRECLDLHERLALGDSATFEGRIPSITDAYHAGHVVVSTSISEGFPYSILEAMASGRAMVATDVGGVREAIGDCGLMVEPRDERGVAEACLELLTNHARRTEFAEFGRRRVLERFTLDLCLARYEGVYEYLTDDVPLATAPAGTPLPSPTGARQ